MKKNDNKHINTDAGLAAFLFHFRSVARAGYVWRYGVYKHKKGVAK